MRQPSPLYGLLVVLVRAMYFHLSLIQALLLPLGTWLLYVADRILDGLRQGELLRERHQFHARHRTAFLLAASFLFVLLAWFVLTRMLPEALRDRTPGLACWCFFTCSRCRRITPRLPKEQPWAFLFAAATAVPAWSRLGAGREQRRPAVIFFALLCWINCVGIEKWEGGQPHAITCWASLHLRLIESLLHCFRWPRRSWPRRGSMVVYLAALLSCGLLYTLDARSGHWAPLHLRIAADAALLTPLALLPFAR